jgi:hypothetical protein
LGEIGDDSLKIGAATPAPRASADHFAEPKDGSRVQPDKAAQSKDSSSQPAELGAAGRGTTLHPVRA